MDIDSLVEQLLLDIALAGHAGLEASVINKNIEDDYARRSSAAASNSATDGCDYDTHNASLADPITQDVFKSAVWQRLEGHPDLTTIGEGSTSTPPQDRGVDEQEPSSSTATPPSFRLHASEERIWQAVAGHAIDRRRLSRKVFELLEVIAAAGPDGILQPQARQLTGQDKQTVPRRSEELAELGYITKERAIVPKMITSRLRLWRFAGVSPTNPDADEANWFDRAECFEKVVSILQANDGVATTRDIELEAGYDTKIKQKNFMRCVARLERSGLLRRIRAKVETDHRNNVADRFTRCLQLLREPSNADRDHALGLGGPVRLDDQGRTKTQATIAKRHSTLSNERVDESEGEDADHDDDSGPEDEQLQESSDEGSTAGDAERSARFGGTDNAANEQSAGSADIVPPVVAPMDESRRRSKPDVDSDATMPSDAPQYRKIPPSTSRRSNRKRRAPAHLQEEVTTALDELLADSPVASDVDTTQESNAAPGEVTRSEAGTNLLKKRKASTVEPVSVTWYSSHRLDEETALSNDDMSTRSPGVFFRAPDPQPKRRGRPRKAIVAVFKSDKLKELLPSLADLATVQPDAENAAIVGRAQESTQEPIDVEALQASINVPDEEQLTSSVQDPIIAEQPQFSGGTEDPTPSSKARSNKLAAQLKRREWEYAEENTAPVQRRKVVEVQQPSPPKSSPDVQGEASTQQPDASDDLRSTTDLDIASQEPSAISKRSLGQIRRGERQRAERAAAAALQNGAGTVSQAPFPATPQGRTQASEQSTQNERAQEATATPLQNSAAPSQQPLLSAAAIEQIQSGTQSTAGQIANGAAAATVAHETPADKQQPLSQDRSKKTALSVPSARSTKGVGKWRPESQLSEAGRASILAGQKRRRERERAEKAAAAAQRAREEGQQLTGSSIDTTQDTLRSPAAPTVAATQANRQDGQHAIGVAQNNAGLPMAFLNSTPVATGPNQQAITPLQAFVNAALATGATSDHDLIQRTAAAAREASTSRQWAAAQTSNTAATSDTIATQAPTEGTTAQRSARPSTPALTEGTRAPRKEKDRAPKSVGDTAVVAQRMVFPYMDEASREKRSKARRDAMQWENSPHAPLALSTGDQQDRVVARSAHAHSEYAPNDQDGSLQTGQGREKRPLEEKDADRPGSRKRRRSSVQEAIDDESVQEVPRATRKRRLPSVQQGFDFGAIDDIPLESRKRRRTGEESDDEYVDAEEDENDAADHVVEEDDDEPAPVRRPGPPLGTRLRNNFKTVANVTVKRTAAGLEASNAGARAKSFVDANAWAKANAAKRDSGPSLYAGTATTNHAVGQLVWPEVPATPADDAGNPQAAYGEPAPLAPFVGPLPEGVRLSRAGKPYLARGWPKGAKRAGARGPRLWSMGNIETLRSLLFSPQQSFDVHNGTFGALPSALSLTAPADAVPSASEATTRKRPGPKKGSKQGPRRPKQIQVGQDIWPLLALLFQPMQSFHAASGTIGTLGMPFSMLAPTLSTVQAPVNGNASKGARKRKSDEANGGNSPATMLQQTAKKRQVSGLVDYASPAVQRVLTPAEQSSQTPSWKIGIDAFAASTPPTGPSTARKRKADELVEYTHPVHQNLLTSPGQSIHTPSWTIGTNAIISTASQTDTPGRGKRLKKSTEKATQFSRLQASSSAFSAASSLESAARDASPFSRSFTNDDGNCPDADGYYPSTYVWDHPEVKFRHCGNGRWKLDTLESTPKTARAFLKQYGYSNPDSVDTAYVNSHPNENFHHRGQGRWLRGLPPPGSSYKVAVKGPDAAAYLMRIGTKEGKSKTHGAVVNGQQLTKDGQPWKKQPKSVNRVLVGPLEDGESFSPPKTRVRRGKYDPKPVPTVQYDVPPPRPLMEPPYGNGPTHPLNGENAPLTGAHAPLSRDTTQNSANSRTNGAGALPNGDHPQPNASYAPPNGGAFGMPQFTVNNIDPRLTSQTVDYGYGQQMSLTMQFQAQQLLNSFQQPVPAPVLPSQPQPTKKRKAYTYKSRKSIAPVGPDGVTPIETDRASDDDYEQGSAPKQRRKRGPGIVLQSNARCAIDWQNTLTAIALVKNFSPADTVKDIRWDLVSHALQSGDKVTAAQLRYNDIPNNAAHAKFAAVVEERMQEPLLAALEKDELPKVDLVDLTKCDWPGLLAWVERAVVAKVVEELGPLPQRLMRPKFAKPGVKLGRKPNKPPKPIVDTTALFPATFNIDAPNATSELDLKEDLIMAKSWVRANLATKDEVYDTAAATAKLNVIGEPMIRKAVAELEQSNTVRRLKQGRTKPGRNWELTQHFWDQFNRWPGEEENRLYLRQLFDARAELLEHFAEHDTFEILGTTPELKTFVLNSMLNQGMLTMEVLLPERNDDVNAPFPKLNAWSYCGMRHNTKSMSRATLDLPVVYTKTAAFTSEHGLRTDVPVPGSPPAREGEVLPRVPLWVDVYGNLHKEMWEKVLSSVLFLLVRKPGISAKGIEKAHQTKLWAWEVETVLEWLEKVGVAERFGAGREVEGVWRGGWTVGKGWYCVMDAEVVGESG